MNYSNSQRAGVILYLTALLFGAYEQTLSRTNVGQSFLPDTRTYHHLLNNQYASTCSPLPKPALKSKRRYISTFSYHTICSFMLNNICFVINFLFQCHIFIIYKRKQILFPITNLLQVIFINYDNIFTFM